MTNNDDFQGRYAFSTAHLYIRNNDQNSYLNLRDNICVVHLVDICIDLYKKPIFERLNKIGYLHSGTFSGKSQPGGSERKNLIEKNSYNEYIVSKLTRAVE